MFVPSFKLLSRVDPERSFDEKKKKKFTYRHTNIDVEKTKTIYPLYTSYAWEINIFALKLQIFLHKSLKIS